MIRGRDILMVGLQSLDINIGSNSVNIAREFARHNRVLYVNYAPDRLTLVRHRKNAIVRKRISIIKGREPALYREERNLWVLNPAVVLEPVNRLRPRLFFDAVNKNNALKFTAKIKEALEELKFDSFILFNDSDFYRSFYLKELLKPSLFLYYSRDNMIETDFFKRYGKKYEGKLMEKADAVVANSEFLRKKALQHNPEAYFVGQGCDHDLFNLKNVKSLPPELERIASPRIGYVGSLTAKRLNLDLLQYIARSKPDWNLVLTGPEDNVFRQSELHQMKNVYFTSAVNQEMLPTYIYYFDVAINPQKLNPLTTGNYPRKIDEYLMMGKAVVATYTEAMDMFRNYVLTAKSDKEFVDKISDALNENTQEMINERMNYARSHTWERNVENIYKVITDVEKKK